MNLIGWTFKAISYSLEGLSSALAAEVSDPSDLMSTRYQKFIPKESFRPTARKFPQEFRPLTDALPVDILTILSGYFEPWTRKEIEKSFIDREKLGGNCGVFESKEENTFVTWEELKQCGPKFLSKKPFKLDLSDTKVTDGDINDIVSRFPNIVGFDLSKCQNLTDDAIISIAEHCPQLQSLKVASCDTLSDAAIISIAEHCPQLQSLDVSWCWNLTNTAIISIAEYCPQLQSLNIHGCDQISNAAIISISENCPQLQSLKVTFCDRISDAAIISISKNSPQLQNLNIHGCNQISNAAILSIAKYCPQLQSLDVTGFFKMVHPVFDNFGPGVKINAY